MPTSKVFRKWRGCCYQRCWFVHWPVSQAAACLGGAYILRAQTDNKQAGRMNWGLWKCSVGCCDGKYAQADPTSRMLWRGSEYQVCLRRQGGSLPVRRVYRSVTVLIPGAAGDGCTPSLPWVVFSDVLWTKKAFPELRWWQERPPTVSRVTPEKRVHWEVTREAAPPLPESVLTTGDIWQDQCCLLQLAFWPKQALLIELKARQIHLTIKRNHTCFLKADYPTFKNLTMCMSEPWVMFLGPLFSSWDFWCKKECVT